jgi:hypothetical protein
MIARPVANPGNRKTLAEEIFPDIGHSAKKVGTDQVRLVIDCGVALCTRCSKNTA